MPLGTHTMTLGRTPKQMAVDDGLEEKKRSIFSVTSKSAMTPSFNGRTARMPSGVRRACVSLRADAFDLARCLFDRDNGGFVQTRSLRRGRRRCVRGAKVSAISFAGLHAPI